MSWTRNTLLTSDRASLQGTGYPARGLYKATTVTSTEKADDGREYLVLVHTALAGFVPTEGGFTGDDALKSIELRTKIRFPGSYKSDWDADKCDQMDEIDSEKLNAALVAHGAVDIEKIRKAVAAKQPVPLSDKHFDGRPVHLLWDPPPMGERGFPELRYIAAEEQFNKLVNGQARVSWPQDKAARRANSRATADAGMGSNDPTQTPATGNNGATRPASPPDNGAADAFMASSSATTVAATPDW